MKKFTFLSFLGALLLIANTTIANDVLFKMAQGTTSNAGTTASGADLDLSSIYYFYVGGSAAVHNGQASDATLVASGIARITNNEGYIKITLPTGVTIQEGDIIRYTGNSDESSKNILLHTLGGATAGGRSGATKVDCNTDYSVKSTDVIVGQNEFYINLGQNISAPNYVKSFTLSRPSELVKFYSFEELTPVDFTENTTTGNVIVANELYLNSDAATSGTLNGIKAAAGGKPQSLYSRGANENRAIMLNVTDPCTVEIWAWSSQKDISISEGSYSASSATKIITGSTVDASVIQKGTYEYTDLVDSKTLYTIPTGGFSVAAIRVTYNKIRPVADLAVDPTALTVSVGEVKNFTITTSSTEAITRSKRNGDDYEGEVKFSGLDGLSNPTGTINGRVEGKDAGTYVMILTQPASANYRAASAEMVITVVSTPTDIDELETATKVNKVIENGQLFILRDGKMFTLTGARVK